jgi:aldehyde dehydrogenase (NAD+)
VSENRNPANTDDVAGLFARGSAAAVALPAWAAMPAPARGNILYKAADVLDRRFEQVAAEMTREEGSR